MNDSDEEEKSFNMKNEKKFLTIECREGFKSQELDGMTLLSPVNQ